MRAIAMVALAGLAAGCAGGGLGSRVHSVTLFSSYQPGAASTFAAAGPLVELRGPPPGGASGDAVAAALRMPGGFAQTPFRLAGPGEGQTRLVLIFGARNIDPARACATAPSARAPSADAAAPVATAGQPLQVGAAFCLGATAASVGVLSAAGAVAPPDPAFAVAMRHLFAEMMPTIVPGRSAPFGGDR